MTCSYGEIMMDEKIENMQRWTRSEHLKYHVNVIHCMRSQWTAHTHTLVSTLRQLCILSLCTPLQEEQHQCGRTHGNSNTTTDNCVSQQGIMGDEMTQRQRSSCSNCVFVFPLLHSTPQSHLMNCCFVNLTEDLQSVYLMSVQYEVKSTSYKV